MRKDRLSPGAGKRSHVRNEDWKAMFAKDSVSWIAFYLWLSLGTSPCFTFQPWQCFSRRSHCFDPAAYTLTGLQCWIKSNICVPFVCKNFKGTNKFHLFMKHFGAVAVDRKALMHNQRITSLNWSASVNFVEKLRWRQRIEWVNLILNFKTCHKCCCFWQSETSLLKLFS